MITDVCKVVCEPLLEYNHDNEQVNMSMHVNFTVEKNNIQKSVAKKNLTSQV